ncbi:DNA polymerase delta catalytic subunit [Acorus calamus]|uniref:DNA polymerase delta catalytic subunit n=1 Tax=Acorus calamus TaxID=4465 RepID=A0AAV9DH86_ACOCL|nr:DNA polymerase delta catalytic subunit [Acorus calamus]
MSSGKRRPLTASTPTPNPPKRFQSNTNRQQQQPPPKPSSMAEEEEEMMDEDVFLEETLLLQEEERNEAFSTRLSKWKRPSLSHSYLSLSQPIVFQQLEIDYVIGESHKELLPSSSGPAAILRIFGVTSEGHSVCCRVHGFEPYFYISCPQGMGPDDISRFHQTLEARMRESNRSSNVPRFVKRIEMLHKRSIMYKELISHAPEGQFSKMAPFRILSFDIECAGRKGLFPEPSHDPVIQVANLVTLQGEDHPLIRNVMTLKSCSPIVGVDVMSFETEKEVLLAWKDFIREIDPVIIGYNICKFDLPYLIERAEALKIAEFPILGRIRNSRFV